MINKQKLQEKISELLNSANKRQTTQGIKVYEGALKKIGCVNTDDELEELTKKLVKALNGMEAHGYYTDEEYIIVKEIREMFDC